MKFLNEKEKALFEYCLARKFGTPEETYRLYAWIDVLETRKRKWERMIIKFAIEGQFTKIPNAAEKVNNAREAIRDADAKIRTIKEELKNSQRC